MPKTLDDLTPQERANLVGTWVTVTHNPRPVIYTGEFESTGEIKHGAIIFDPLYGGNYARLDHCTPQFDLPRAWNPNGTPVNGHWEYAVQYKTPDGEWQWSRKENNFRWQYSEAAQEVRAVRDHRNKETRVVRRLITQPEEI